MEDMQNKYEQAECEIANEQLDKQKSLNVTQTKIQMEDKKSKYEQVEHEMTQEQLDKLNTSHAIEDEIPAMEENIDRVIDLFMSKKRELEAPNTSEEILKYFYKQLNNKTPISMVFSSADVEGNFSAYIVMGYSIYMPNEELLGKPFNPMEKHKMLDKEIPVVVYDINEDKKRIYVSRNRAKEQAQSKLRIKLKKQLENRNPEKPIIVKAVITYVDTYSQRVIIDIGGVGIMGVIPVKHWKWGHEYHLQKVAKKDRTIEVEVIDYRAKKKDRSKNLYHSKEFFICSRMNLLPNPWINIEEKFPVNTVVTFTCISRLERFFFGRIDGLLDIDVYVLYPKRNIPIIEGMKYQGNIFGVSEEKKILRAKVFKMLPNEIE